MSGLPTKPDSSKLEPSGKAHHILRVHLLLQGLQPLYIPSIYILQWRIVRRISWKLPPSSLPLERRNRAYLLRALLHCITKHSVLRRIFPGKPDHERREAVCTVGRICTGGKVVGQVGRKEKVEGVGDVARSQFRS